MKKSFFKTLFAVTIILFLLAPVTHAQSTTFLGSLNDFYVLGLSVVGIAALLWMVYGGFQYMASGESETLAKAGKEKIKNALLGILVAAISYAILYTINPDLVELKLDPAANINKVIPPTPQ